MNCLWKQERDKDLNGKSHRILNEILTPLHWNIFLKIHLSLFICFQCSELLILKATFPGNQASIVKRFSVTSNSDSIIKFSHISKIRIQHSTELIDKQSNGVCNIQIFMNFFQVIYFSAVNSMGI